MPNPSFPHPSLSLLSLLLHPCFTHCLPYSSFLLPLLLARRSGEAVPSEKWQLVTKVGGAQIHSLPYGSLWVVSSMAVTEESSSASTIATRHRACAQYRDDREWVFTFPFPPIVIPKLESYSHSRSESHFYGRVYDSITALGVVINSRQPITSAAS